MRQQENRGRKCVRLFWNTICFYWHFQLWSQLANPTKENCHCEWQPFRGLPCPANKWETAPWRRGWQGILGQTLNEPLTCLLQAQVAAITARLKRKYETRTVDWCEMAVSSLSVSILACHVADRIIWKCKRRQPRPRLLSKISWVSCAAANRNL